VIGKLKYSCGAQYTSKIEGMVSDAKTSIESSAEFGKWVKARASRSNKSTKSSSLSSSPPNDSAIASGATRREQASPLLFDLGGDFNARVLTSGFWPSHPEENLVLPDYMTATLGEFEKYYMDKFRRRRLKWIHSVATVTIGATFKSRAYGEIATHITQRTTIKHCTTIHQLLVVPSPSHILTYHYNTVGTQ